MEFTRRFRTKLFGRGQRYETPSAESAIKKYVNLAKQSDLDPSLMANAFVNSRDFVTSNIIGATTMPQLKLAIESEKTKLSEDVLTELDKSILNAQILVHKKLTNKING